MFILHYPYIKYSSQSLEDNIRPLAAISIAYFNFPFRNKILLMYFKVSGFFSLKFRAFLKLSRDF